TISLTNTGEVELTGVTFTDVMPLGVQVVSVDGPDWDCAWTPGSPDTIDCAHQPDTLPVGKSATITIVATVIAVSSDQPTGTWVNQGTASSNETPDVPTDGNSDPNDGEQPTEF